MPCEIITADLLAERWHVSVRWVMDNTRSKDDPIPHFKRGRKRLYEWWDCAESVLQAWWNRHQCCRGNGSNGRANASSRKHAQPARLLQ